MPDDQPRTLYFPPELAALVVDNLGDNASALYACSLVCRAWTPLSRRHLFKELFIIRRTRGPSPDRRPDSTVGLNRSPGEEEGASEAQGRAQNVDVQDNDIGWASGVVGNPEDKQGHDSYQDGAFTSKPRPLYTPVRWRFKSEHSDRAPASATIFSSPHCTIKPHIRLLRLMHDDADERTGDKTSAAILRTFAALPMLRELEIYLTRLSAVDTDAIVTSFPQITKLMLRGAHIAINMWTLVASFPALVALDISYTDWPRSEEPPPPLPAQQPLVLDTLGGAARELVRLPAGHLTTRALSVRNLTTEDLFALAAALPRLGALVDLYLEFADPISRELPLFFLDAADLAAHPALAALSLACDDPAHAPALVAALPAYLAAVPARLARIALRIALSSRYVEHYAWAAADAALAQHAGLRAVALELRIEEDVMPQECERVVAVVRAYLPEADRRGILSIAPFPGDHGHDHP